MKINILIYLHLEFKPFNTHDINADIVVLAGNIKSKTMKLLNH